MSTPTTHHAPRRRKPPAPKPQTAKAVEPESAEFASPPAASFTEPERRHAMISDAAYYLAEQRDFCPGHELEDWLTAEREIDTRLGTSQSF